MSISEQPSLLELFEKWCIFTNKPFPGALCCTSWEPTEQNPFSATFFLGELKTGRRGSGVGKPFSHTLVSVPVKKVMPFGLEKSVSFGGRDFLSFFLWPAPSWTSLWAGNECVEVEKHSSAAPRRQRQPGWLGMHRMSYRGWEKRRKLSKDNVLTKSKQQNW